MSTPVPLPALGESVTEGTISRWLKKVGDRVEVDEPLVEVSTDKVDTEIPSPVAGVVLEILVEEDGVAPVGAVLATIGEAGEADQGSGGAPTEPTAESAPAESAPVASEERAEEQAPESTSAPSTQPAPQQPAPQQAAQPAQPPSQAAPEQSAGATEVVLPQLGESVTEGTVSRWLKKVGDQVEADEPLVEVSTDKVDTEIPSPAAGVVLEIRVAEDATAEVGAVLAVIGSAAAAPAAEPEAPAAPSAPEPATPAEPAAPAAPEQAASPAPPAQPAPPASPAPAPSPATAPAPAPSPAPARRAADDAPESSYVTPLVRKMAEANGIDLNTITGTGVGGRIRKQDVLAAAEAAKKAAEAAAKAAAAPAPVPEPAPAEAAPAAPSAPAGADAGKRGTTEKMTRIRATIARRMVESLQVSAQLTATVEVDLTAISKLRAKVKDDFRAREGVGLSYLPFIAKAAVEALKQFPKVNATIDTEAGTITYGEAEHLGVAVDTEKGLMVPVIKDAGDLSVTGLAKKIGDLAARSRSNKVTPDELSGGTFTITNYGSAGTLFDTPIINQPQVAILGTGALVKRPMVVKDPNLGEIIAVRDMMYLSMSYDHRLVDGADAARFLSFVKARLEEGDFDL